MRAKIIVKGIVQGVGFRPFIYRIAKENKLLGYVRNRGDAGVEVNIEGRQDSVTHFIAEIKEKKPPLAQIYDISIQYQEDKSEFKDFSIIRSFEGGNLSGSVIPFDTSICDECLKELRDPENRRNNYFFTTCTDCGPRYTIIKSLPYDRLNTTMNGFFICEECRKEYADPLNRRFHAQTIACPICGPTAFLTTNDGKILENDDPIRTAGKLIGEGYITAIKGNGGFHITASATKNETIRRLRKTKKRSQKPFALMAKDLKTIQSFAQVSNEEENLLASSTRPIILLKKKND
ncbi:MAG: hydrogenase maturation protein HypF, partial [Thermoproteota archaeon]|nr:hydrogenase maturation protein HypF [Thermoproteota archaeon]